MAYMALCGSIQHPSGSEIFVIGNGKVYTPLHDGPLDLFANHGPLTNIGTYGSLKVTIEELVEHETPNDGKRHAELSTPNEKLGTTTFTTTNKSPECLSDKPPTRRICLLLRGHVRGSFCSGNLREFICSLKRVCDELDVYVHTWSTANGEISWRPVTPDQTAVTHASIAEYLKDAQVHVRKITIEREEDLTALDQSMDPVSGSLMPKKGWARYWHGQAAVLKSAMEHQSFDTPCLVVNCRMDIFENPIAQYHGVSPSTALDFICKNQNREFTQNHLMTSERFVMGCDNLYVGSIKTMQQIVTSFLTDIDRIIEEHPVTRFQEELFFWENQQIQV